jgi:2-polyprenyl-6-methoxyphenol hydroxylase-like FAD-dependent oxidoreductase
MSSEDTRHRHDPRVLVVGAGVAGLALARALLRGGVDCTVVERRTGIAADGLALNLPGNAVRALMLLGVADEVLGRGVRIDRREYRNARGRLLFAVDEAAFWSGIAPSVCVRHGHVLRALLRGLEPNIRYGVRVTGVTPGADRVLVEFGEAEPETFDLVVGADGVHSAVRPAVASAGALPSAMTSASWRFITDDPGVGCWTVWTGRRGTFLLIPVEPGRVYGYASSSQGDSPGKDREWLRQTFVQYPTPVPQTVDLVLTGSGELYHSPVEEVRCHRWSEGRVILIGDAAHATGPVWAQGAASALDDAAILADLLTTRDDWSAVGPEFEQARRPSVDHVQAATDEMSRLARLPGVVRDLVAPVLGPRGYRRAYEPLRPPPGR